jgi:four helix bundle protein
VLKTYKELVVWQKAFRLCTRAYELSRQFPGDERFGLTAQVRRAAASVPSNIAEGYNRGATREYVRFLWIANASLAELETQLMLAAEMGFAGSEEVSLLLEAVEEIERMLRALIRSLEQKVS